jgi:hypothetical protein
VTALGKKTAILACTAALFAVAASLAHASMSFADGRTLSSTLTRSCTVKE